MTSHAKVEYAATNIEILQLFVAAIRVVAPDLVQDLLRTSGRHRKKAQIGQETIGALTENLNFKFGKDVWTWVTNRYETMAIPLSSLSDEQRETAQHLLRGMFQELILGNLVEYPD